MKKCKIIDEVGQCTYYSWEDSQSRTLTKYYLSGDINAFDCHLEYLKSIGCSITYIQNDTIRRFEVERPYIDYGKNYKNAM